jgi:hypothetical protein
MSEVWVSLIGFKFKYEVSNKGRIRNQYGRYLCGPKLSSKGYLRVNLRLENGEPKVFYLHQIIASIFVQNKNNKEQVNHKDGNKLNNKACNLEWVTNQENRDHAVKHGLHARGEVCSKFTNENIIEIRRLYDNKILSQYKIAKLFNSRQQTISKIVRREAWKHI